MVGEINLKALVEESLLADGAAQSLRDRAHLGDSMTFAAGDARISWAKLLFQAQPFQGEIDTFTRGYVYQWFEDAAEREIERCGDNGAHVALVPMWIGTDPGSDRTGREQNTAALMSLERFPGISIEMTWDAGRGAKCDGWFHADERAAPELRQSGGAIPIEVGACNPSTLMLHVSNYGGFARWPFGERYLWIYTLPGRRSFSIHLGAARSLDR